MRGLDAPGMVDLVGEEQTGEISLIISHDKAWTDEPVELERLATKINNYASFALDGGLLNQFPESAGRPLRILVDCVTAPTPEVSALLHRAEAQLATYSLGLAVNYPLRG
ncbi:DUF6572 domain-containing protein [Microlunatus soli]|uniref:Uncharacterized protein n=1 Tax=Microlunatus soli TaxID=630515 RepID=A0A1H1MKQ1_9ACTN|nr:DUF6572 domain-containing protein [Microlunatus soli]SDR87306.1 hypothetical protein SAMN04489812_0175 [Microlunatus soli]